jgi:hypothetical protein
MILTEDELVCPAGKPGKSPIIIPIKKILMDEKRQEEVAIVNKSRAPELLAAFNKAYREIHEFVTKLTAERNQAEKEIDRRRAHLLLNVVPEALKKAELSNNDDHRQAVIDSDIEYQRYVDVLDEISVAIEYLKGKLKSFDNAFTSVKRLVQEEVYGGTAGRKNPNLSDSGHVGERSPEPIEQASPQRRFGRARF